MDLLVADLNINATSYGSYRNMSKSVFGWSVIYGKKRNEYRTKTTVARQRRTRYVYF